MNKSDQDYILARVKVTPYGCWEWFRCRCKKGYGQISRGGKLFRAHRVAWSAWNGPVPKGLGVLHSCDNPPCCTPAPLRPGTQLDNMRDRAAKGRANHAKGIGHGMTKLSEDQVSTVKGLLGVGVSTRELSRRLNIHRSTIMDIKRDRTWKHHIDQ